MVPASSTYGATGISSFSWSSGTPSCGFELAGTTTEDLSCGTGGTGGPMYGTGHTYQYYTTCTTNPGCPQGTSINVTQNWAEHYTWPNGNPTGQECQIAGGQGQWDLFLDIN